MKRLLCIFVSILMLVSFFPFNVFANDYTSSEYDELIELACEVFPEYASAIRGENISSYARTLSNGDIEAVYQETRSISDNETLGLTILSTGDAIVVKCNFDEITLTANSSDVTDISGIGVTGTASFQVASYGHSFRLSDVRYTIYDYASDYFTNYGSVTSCTFHSYGKIQESSSVIEYYVRLSSAQTAIVYLKLQFSNNKLVAQLT